MGKFNGKSGKVEWKTGAETDDIVDHCQNWNCSISCDTAETTSMTNGTSANNYRARVAGLFDWAGSFEVINDMAGEIDLTHFGAEEISAGVAHEVGLYLNGTAGDTLHVIYGSIILTGISPSSPVDDVTKTTYTFQGTGAAPTLAVGSSVDPEWHD